MNYNLSQSFAVEMSEEEHLDESILKHWLTNYLSELWKKKMQMEN